MAIDAVIEAELARALDEPDPLRGIATLMARFAAPFVLRRRTLRTAAWAFRLGPPGAPRATFEQWWPAGRAA